MNCENYLCIYEKGGVCLLDTIRLDILGQCTDCIYVNINKSDLDILKKQQRYKLEKDD